MSMGMVALDVQEREIIDLDSYIPSAVNHESKRLLRLYWIIDNWREDMDSLALQKNHAQVLRARLNQLFDYYFENGQESKAQLAVTLCGATFHAEEAGFTIDQLNALETLFVYFQRINLTSDNLKECHRYLVQHGIYTLPEALDWQTAILDH